MKKISSGRLCRSVALGALFTATSGFAFAQQTQPTVDTVQPAEEQEADDGDVVVITGSRIQNDTFSSASAMTVVTADEATVQGVTDIASLLQNSIAAAGSSQTTAAISAAIANPEGGLGTQTLSLRGLGAQRTLVLLNGRRAGPSGTGGQVGPFDLNVIPLSAVARVDILKDGASSLYGSDAIAGVVNIITKKDSSSSFDISYTYPEMGAGAELSVSGTWGQEFDNGYFRVSADYYKQDEFDRGDRDIFNCSQLYAFKQSDGTRADLFDERRDDYTCTADVIWGHNWTYDYGSNSRSGGFRHRPWQTTAGRYQYDYSGTLGGFLQPFSQLSGQPTSAQSGIINPAGWYPVGYQNIITSAVQDPIWGPSARNSGAYQDFYHPLQDQTTLSPAIERMSIVAEGEFDITDSIKAYGEVLLNRRTTMNDSYTQIYSFQYQYRYAGSPVFGDPIAEEAGWTLRDDLEADDYYYVLHSPTAITDWADETVGIDYVRLVAGLSGDVGFPMPGWTFDLSAQFSRSDGDRKEQISFVDAITDHELRTADTLCEGTLTRYRGVPCVDINWYAPNLNYGILTPEEQAFLHGYAISRTIYEQTTVEGYITGKVAPLPAGDLSAVFGFLYQDDSILDKPDQAYLDGEVWTGGPTRRGITEGNDDTRAAYFELQVPIFKDMPLAEQVTLSLSGRYTDVASYGGDSTWKAGLSWAITDDLRIRGSQGTSFRAPGLYELYLAEQVSRFAQAGDPCAQWGPKLAAQQITQRMADNCARDPKFPGGIGPTQLSTGGIQATVYTSGGIGNLTAETSESRSLGVIWAPEYLGDLQISVDYFDIVVEGQVGRVSNAYIVRQCYDSPNFPTEPLCNLFSRKQPGESPPGPIKELFNNYLNIAAQTSRGVDIEVHYGLETQFGDLDFTLRAARQLEAGDQLLPDSPFLNSNGEAGEPPWVANLNTSYEAGPLSVFWGVRYVDATSNLDDFTEANPTQPYTFLGTPVNFVLSTPPRFYHTLSVGYDFEDLGLNARFGVRNLLDEEPPQTSSNAGYLRLGNAVIESQYDLYGRTYFINLSKSF